MPNSPQHIIWLTPGFAANAQDDACIPPLQLLARAWEHNAAIQLHIITLHYPFKSDPYTFAGAQVYPHYRSGILTNWRTRLAAFYTAKRLMKQYPNALIHSFWLTDAAILGQRLSQLYQRPHIVTLMGQDARSSNRYLSYFSLAKMQLVCLSKKHLQTLRNQVPSAKATIIPWGISKADMPKQQRSTRPFDLIGIGSLIPLKGYDRFLQTVAILKKEHPYLRAILIGDGPTRSALQQQAATLGITQNVTFTGKIPRREVLEHLAQSKVFLHTSTYESFGYVLVEALASGTAVVSTSVGIAPELASIAIGEQPKDLAQRVAALLSNWKEENRQYIPFTMTVTQQQYHALYQTIVDKVEAPGVQ